MSYGKLTIEEAFEKFDAANPNVYRKFQELAFEAIKKGKKHSSSKMIIEVIRWQMILETTGKDQYKINNNFTAHYARKFATKNPQHHELFKTRGLKAKGKPVVSYAGKETGFPII